LAVTLASSVARRTRSPSVGTRVRPAAALPAARPPKSVAVALLVALRRRARTACAVSALTFRALQDAPMTPTNGTSDSHNIFFVCSELAPGMYGPSANEK
jgi:hypothetical protein